MHHPDPGILNISKQLVFSCSLKLADMSQHARIIPVDRVTWQHEHRGIKACVLKGLHPILRLWGRRAGSRKMNFGAQATGLIFSFCVRGSNIQVASVVKYHSKATWRSLEKTEVSNLNRCGFYCSPDTITPPPTQKNLSVWFLLRRHKQKVNVRKC